MKLTIKQRAQYSFFLPIQTRWADNDLYGHVNNVTYYSYFDTAANTLLIQKQVSTRNLLLLSDWWLAPTVNLIKNCLIPRSLRWLWQLKK